jgi:hypothetical protein
MDPLPPQQTMVWLKQSDGSEVLGWRVYSSQHGKSLYWTHSKDAPLPSRYTSTLQKAGVKAVYPVAWRPYEKTVVDMPAEPISLREAECLMLRTILTDSTMMRPAQSGLKSSWDDTLHIASGNVGDYVGQISDSLRIKFIPEPRDRQNYLVCMAWFCQLTDARQRKSYADGFALSIPQRVVALRAYRLSFEAIGDRVGPSKQRCNVIYKTALDRIWTAAAADQDQLSRLPKHLWEEGPVLT